MAAGEVSFRDARPEDAELLALLIRIAYRGTAGWTSEAGLLDDERIDADGVRAKMMQPDGLVLVVESTDDHRIIGCCELVSRGNGLAYFGLFAVDPELQAGGLGRRVLARAEELARSRWSAHTMEMQVIAHRSELIEWYERRGYRRSGDTRPFPYDQLINGTALRDDLYFVVLTKSLSTRSTESP